MRLLCFEGTGPVGRANQDRASLGFFRLLGLQVCLVKGRVDALLVSLAGLF